MGLHDRPYMKESGGGYGRGPGRGITFGMPKPPRAVKVLLLINVVVFVVQIFMDNSTPRFRFGLLSTWFGVTLEGFWQLWRYVTFQFLHGGFWHILLNMLGVYILGSPLEREWGTRRFVTFYLLCGVVSGVTYVVVGALYRQPAWVPLIGASGGVYGLILACAVLFPHIQIIFLFFPVPIRFAALIIFGAMIIVVLQAFSAGRFDQAMSDVCHFGGAVTAAVWIWGIPRLRGAALQANVKRRHGAWERKVRREGEEDAEVDRILQKIKDEGLSSLTRSERRTLQDATRRQREDEQTITRM